MTENPADLDAYPVAKTIEMRGETCPLPEIEAKLWLKKLAAGEVLEMFFDDPLGAEFFPKFCEKKGYPHRMTKLDDSFWHLLILKR